MATHSLFNTTKEEMRRRYRLTPIHAANLLGLSAGKAIDHSLAAASMTGTHCLHRHERLKSSLPAATHRNATATPPSLDRATLSRPTHNSSAAAAETRRSGS